MMFKLVSELLTRIKFYTRPTYLLCYNIQESVSRKFVIVRLNLKLLSNYYNYFLACSVLFNISPNVTLGLFREVKFNSFLLTAVHSLCK